MTEDEARAWLAERVPRETINRLEGYVTLVLAEASRQNLISATSVEHVWARHIVDSVQLIDHASGNGRWVDLGAGAGFPGMVVGILGHHPVTLVETRAKRVVFLSEVIESLGLKDRVTIFAGKVERLEATPFDILSARAFAPLDRLLATAYHLSTPASRWILPKGRSATAELEVASRSWQGSFSTVPSITDPEAAIILAENVRPRSGVRSNRSPR